MTQATAKARVTEWRPAPEPHLRRLPCPTGQATAIPAALLDDVRPSAPAATRGGLTSFRRAGPRASPTSPCRDCASPGGQSLHRPGPSSQEDDQWQFPAGPLPIINGVTADGPRRSSSPLAE